MGKIFSWALGALVVFFGYKAFAQKKEKKVLREAKTNDDVPVFLWSDGTITNALGEAVPLLRDIAIGKRIMVEIEMLNWKEIPVRVRELQEQEPSLRDPFED